MPKLKKAPKIAPKKRVKMEEPLTKTYSDTMTALFELDAKNHKKEHIIKWLRRILLVVAGMLIVLAYIKFAYIVHVSDLGDLILLKR